MTLPNVTIRSARPHDIAVVHDLGQPEFQDPTRYDWGFSADALTALCDPDYGLLYVAEHDRRIVGFIGGVWSFPESSAIQWRVVWLYVVPSMRRQGLGSELIKIARREAASRGKTSICIGVFQENRIARAVFTHLGFVSRAALLFYQSEL